MMTGEIWVVLTVLASSAKADIFETELYPGSTGIVSFVPVATKHTLIFVVTVAVLLYGGANLFRRFYLERYDLDADGKLHPVECKPTKSLINALFSLSRRWGVVRPPLTTQMKRQHVFAGWAQAFTQQKHYWKKIGEGMVTISHYPDTDRYQLVMKTAAEVVLINHELTKNMALFRDEHQGRYVSRWSAIDFASLQPRAETFCLRWTNLGVAESFNTSFYKCTQPGSYTDADMFPLTMEKNMVPGRAKIMDFIGQSPSGMNKFVQTSAGDGDYYCYPGRTDPRTIAPECMQYCDPYGCQSQQVCTYPQPPVYHQHGGFQKYRPATASTSQAGSFTVKGNPNKESSYQSESQKQPASWPSESASISAPSTIGAQPSRMGAQPSRMGGKPSRMGGQPSRIGGQPSRMGGQPSRIGGQPSRMGGQPSRIGGQPSRIGGQPSRMGGQPSRIGGQPSRIGGQPSRIGGQPSKMGATKSVLASHKKVTI